MSRRYHFKLVSLKRFLKDIVMQIDFFGKVNEFFNRGHFISQTDVYNVLTMALIA